MFAPVLQRLEPFARVFIQHGKQVYLVGGAVRNLLLGRSVQDFDFTTDAQPFEVQSYFRKVLPTGLQHGTVTVLFQGASYEVTTFRVDGNYTDGRRPASVTFTPSLEEDLRRRDFTINAMALNLSSGVLIDPHGGQDDLKQRLLRAIGDPGQRFDEDALRLLRLFRFASQLDFSIEPATLAAVPPRRSRLAAVSRERIREELSKAMSGSAPERAWTPLQEMGFLADLFSPLAVRPLSTTALKQLVRLPADLRWSFWLTLALPFDLTAWDKGLRALTFSNADRDAFLGPAKALSFFNEETPLPIGAKAAVEVWGHRDRVTSGVTYLGALEEAGWWKDDKGWKQELLRVASTGEPVFLSDLAVGGKDLLANGVAPGPLVGQTLKRIQREVWADASLNSTERLLTMVRNLP